MAKKVQSDWKQIQKKVFTNWFNDRLRGNLKVAKRKVDDLEVDLQDGLFILEIMEIIAKPRKPGRYNKNPRGKLQCIENLGIALKFIASENIKLVNIGPEDIYGCNGKLILGLVWTLIARFQIRSKGRGLSTKQGMKEWLHTQIPEYPIDNFNTDWNDGKRLCGLVNRLKPGTCPNHLSLKPSDGLKNCQLGMELANEHLNIPMILDPEDLNNPDVDDLSVMTYLSYFFEPAKEQLLNWLQQKLPHRKITNVSKDWNDGTNLAALMEACHDGLFPDYANLDPHNALDNVEKCLELAKSRLGIECPVSAKDFTDPEVDEIVIATYLSRFKYSKVQAVASDLAISPPKGSSVVNEPIRFPANMGFDPDQTKKDLEVTAKAPDGEIIPMALDISNPNDTVAMMTPHVPGEYEIEAKFQGDPIDGSPFTTVVIDPKQWKMTPTPPKFLFIGKPHVMDISGETYGASPVIACEITNSQGLPADHIEADVEEDGKDKYKATLKPTGVGEAIVQACVAGKNLPNSPFSVSVYDPSKCTVSGLDTDEPIILGDEIAFTIDAEDAGDTKPQVDTHGPTKKFKPAVEEAYSKGLYNVAFSPVEAGDCIIDVTFAGEHVDGSPFTVSIVDANKWQISPFPECLQVGEMHEIEIVGSANLPGKPACKVTTVDGTPTGRLTTDIDQYVSNPERWMLALNPLSVGTVRIGITYDNKHIGSSPYDVAICNTSKCKVEGLEGDTANLGEPLEFTLDTTDAGDLSPKVKITGPTATYNPETTENDDGSSTLAFTPFEVGPVTIAIMYGGKHMPGSPFKKVVESLPDVESCSARGSGLHSAVAGQPATFTIITPERDLLDKGDGALSVEILSITGKTRVDPIIEDNNDKTYDVTYTIPHEGEFLIDIKFYGQPIPGSDFMLYVIPRPNAAKCRMHGPALHPNALLIAGRPLELYVDTEDAGDGDLQVVVQGPKKTSPKVFMAESEGSYTLRVDTYQSGWYRINIWWSDVHIPKSPIDLRVYRAPDASQVQAFGPGLGPLIEVHKPAEFTILTRGAGIGTLTVVVHGIKDAFRVNVQPESADDPRTLKGVYYPREAGEYNVTIKWSDDEIPQSPFPVKVIDPVLERHQMEEQARKEARKKQKKEDKAQPKFLPVTYNPMYGGHPQDMQMNPSMAGFMMPQPVVKSSRKVETRQVVRQKSSQSLSGEVTRQHTAERKLGKKLKESRSFTETKSATASAKARIIRQGSVPTEMGLNAPPPKKLQKSKPASIEAAMQRSVEKMGDVTPVSGSLRTGVPVGWSGQGGEVKAQEPEPSEDEDTYQMNKEEETKKSSTEKKILKNSGKKLSYYSFKEGDIPEEQPITYQPVYIATGDMPEEESKPAAKSKKTKKKKKKAK